MQLPIRKRRITLSPRQINPRKTDALMSGVAIGDDAAALETQEHAGNKTLSNLDVRLDNIAVKPLI
jgi:hypothetical protein